MKRTEAQSILGELAASQFGLVTSAQAKALGVDGVTLLRLRDAGLLDQVGRGVHLINGAAPPTHLEIRVAWLRLDPTRPAWERDGFGEKDGVVSHRSACLLHQLGDIPAPNVELTVSGRLSTREHWVKLHRHDGPLPVDDVTHVDGLPVTTVNRTVLDLLRSGADAGHVGGVIADAERRGLLDLDALAEQAGRYADRYAMARASGAELLSALAAEAGQLLQRDKALEALSGAAAAGYQDAVLHMLHIQAPAASLWHGNLSQLLSPVQGELGRAMAAQLDPALSELNKSLTANVAAQLAPLRDAAGQVVAAQLSPALNAMKQAVATRASEYLAPLLQNPEFTAALRERLADIILPDGTITAMLEQAAADESNNDSNDNDNKGTEADS